MWLKVPVEERDKDGKRRVSGFWGIETQGLEEWLNGIREDLRAKTYQPQAVRRVMIPKPGGGQRPLGIPTIRDRVVQTAVKRRSNEHIEQYGRLSFDDYQNSPGRMPETIENSHAAIRKWIEHLRPASAGSERLGA